MNIADEHSSLIQIILVSVDVVHHDALKGDLQTTLTSFWIYIIFINPCLYHSCHCLLPLTLIPYFSSKPSLNYLWVYCTGILYSYYYMQRYFHFQNSPLWLKYSQCNMYAFILRHSSSSLCIIYTSDMEHWATMAFSCLMATSRAWGLTSPPSQTLPRWPAAMVGFSRVPFLKMGTMLCLTQLCSWSCLFFKSKAEKYMYIGIYKVLVTFTGYSGENIH